MLLELSANLAFEYGFASRCSPSRYCVRQQRFIAQDRWSCLLGFKNELSLDTWTSISLRARPIADQQPNCVVGILSRFTGHRSSPRHPSQYPGLGFHGLAD